MLDSRNISNARQIRASRLHTSYLTIEYRAPSDLSAKPSGRSFALNPHGPLKLASFRKFSSSAQFVWKSRPIYLKIKPEHLKWLRFTKSSPSKWLRSTNDSAPARVRLEIERPRGFVPQNALPKQRVRSEIPPCLRPSFSSHSPPWLRSTKTLSPGPIRFVIPP